MNTIQFDSSSLNKYRNLTISSMDEARVVMRELRLLDLEAKAISKELSDVYAPLTFQVKDIIRDQIETNGFKGDFDLQGVRFKYTEKEVASVADPVAFYQMVLREVANRIVSFDEASTNKLREEFKSLFNYDMITCLMDLTKPNPTTQMTEEWGVTKVTTSTLTVTPRAI